MEKREHLSHRGGGKGQKHVEGGGREKLYNLEGGKMSRSGKGKKKVLWKNKKGYGKEKRQLCIRQPGWEKGKGQSQGKRARKKKRGVFGCSKGGGNQLKLRRKNRDKGPPSKPPS